MFRYQRKISKSGPTPTTVSPLNDAGQWPNLQLQQPSFPSTVSHSTSQQTTTTAGGALNSEVGFMVQPSGTIFEM